SPRARTDEGDASPTDATRARVDSNRELRWARREHAPGRAARPAAVDVGLGHDHRSARGHSGAARNGRGAGRGGRAGAAALRRQGRRGRADAPRRQLSQRRTHQARCPAAAARAVLTVRGAPRARAGRPRRDGGRGVWFYTTGEVTGRLPLVGWVTVLSWQREPEVVRRQGEVWRLVGFQD